MFWADSVGDPAAIHHVALYIGDHKVIHAPESGDVVKISEIWQDELVHTATRPGA
jgi:cell wall-associated NlpC family hydrolase